MKTIERRRATGRGDGISVMLSRRASEAKTLAKTLRSGKLRGAQARKIEKKIEMLALDADLLWRIRQKMVEISRGPIGD